MPKRTGNAQAAGNESASCRRLGKRVYKVKRSMRMTSGGPWTGGRRSDRFVPRMLL